MPQPGSPLLKLFKKRRGEEGREWWREGGEDDGTGVEFTHPAGRARYWCDESLVLLWKTEGMLVIYNLAEGKCDCLLYQDVFKFEVLFKD